ncbi:MAG: pyridoxal phosphate-dependent aminotransferase [Acidobacteriota bacterium]|nr:pyridoxal phosphate-dependent aminotransferase [Acidobacteriota bacterium]
MKFSGRISRVGESATLEVTRRSKELEASGIDVIDLSAGEPDFDSPPEAIEAAVDALRGGMTRYTAAAGIPELRQAIAEDYSDRFGAPWQTNQVVVTVGGKTGLLELALTLLDRGDEAILPSPYWVTFPEQIRLAGAEPVIVESRPEEGFRVQPERIVDAFTEATRLVILNSPCNPTGSVISAEDLRSIVEACAEREIVVLSDETYERFLYDGAEFASVARLAEEFPDTVILCGSFSKTYAMTGWRVGFVIAPQPVVKRVVALQSHATSNPTTFAMVGALAALRRAGPSIPAMTAEYQVRRDLVTARLSAMEGVECLAPAGAFYAFPRVADCYAESAESGPVGSVAFCSHLLDTARVATVPGVAFGADDFLRISFACSRDKLDRGLERMASAVRARSR